METGPLKSFAIKARTDLLKEIGARLDVALAPGSSARLENASQVVAIEKLVARGGRDAIIERVAYTWFNRIIALRFMDANGYTSVGVVSPAAGHDSGQPEVLANAKAGTYDSSVVPNKVVAEVSSLIAGSRPSPDPQGEAYGLLLEAYCRHWHKHMNFMFEKEADYTEVLVPTSLLSSDSIRDRAVKVLTKDVCQDVEVIGWLYQFYISEQKEKVFVGFKKNKKAGAGEIPAATQLFTPHWIVRYLVENSLGRLWMLNHPNSSLASQMDYYIAPVDEETDFLKITKPEDLKIIDPACGSGHMLTYAFDLLYAIYEEEGYSPADIPSLILTHNLYGTEIDGRAGSLAAFALTMKAREKQRTFFSKEVEPNICVIEPISFTQEELSYLVTRDGDKHTEEAFWNQFTEADTLGSLIRPSPELTVSLSRYLRALDGDGDIYKANAIERAWVVIRQAEYLVQRYSVGITNPPYMGQRNVSEVLQRALKSDYPTSKADLYSAFIERLLDMISSRGYLAMITMQSWMFLTTYEGLRSRLLSEGQLVTLAHFGPRAFDSIGGEVVSTAAFVLELNSEQRTATFVRLTDLGSEALKSAALRACTRGGEGTRRFEVRADSFAAIPGSPFAYWLPEAARAAFGSLPSLGSIASPRVGMQTSNNTKYLRSWWEVSASEAAAPLSSASKWITYLKGGSFRRWYGNVELLLHYKGDPAYLLSQQNATILPLERGLAPKVTWTNLTTGDFSARLAPLGAFHDIGGHCFYPAEGDVEWVLGYSNSRVFQMYLSTLNSTMNAQVGDVAKIPVPDFDREEMSQLARRAAELSRRDFDRSETSIGYQSNELLANRHQTRSLRANYETLVLRWQDEVDELRRVEEAVDTVADPDGVSDWFRPADYPRVVSLDVNAAYSFPRSLGHTRETAQRGAAVSDLVSYAVGCMFGRYSLDSLGLILADQGATMQDYLAKVPSPTFTPDADNVIPIVDGDWFEDDIVERFRVFLKAAFGEEYFEENLAFITESLGVKNLRDYFVKSFYKDHIQRYKKRPIYWLFSSPKGSFNALIYLHRYTPTTVSTVLNEYLRAYQTKLEVRLAFLEGQVTGGGNAKEVAQASKESEKIRAVLVELKAYETDLYQLAQQQIALNLDDGVKVNYGKFGKVLKDFGINQGGGDD